MAKRLTAIGVEQIKPRATRFEVPDGGCVGMYLSIQPSGKRRFVVRYRIAGRPAKYTLDAGLSLKAAREAATAVLNKAAQGVDPAGARREAAAAAELAAGDTLRAVAERYLQAEERKPEAKRLRTIPQRRATFERLIYPDLGGRPVHEIRRGETTRRM